MTVFLIDSKKQLSGSINSFDFVLKKTFKNVSTVNLLNTTIPTAFYNVILGENNTITVDATNLNISAGNYTTNTLKTEIETVLNTNFVTQNFLVSFDMTTLKTTIFADSNFAITYIVFLKLLGFESTQTLSGFNSYTSNYAFNLHPINHFYITVGQLYQNVHLFNPDFSCTFIVLCDTTNGNISYFNNLNNYVINSTNLNLIDGSMLRVEIFGDCLDGSSTIKPLELLSDWQMIIKFD